MNRDEQKRLAALYSYHILDTESEKDFDDLTELASVICNTPIALISFVDEHRQWFKSIKGIDIKETDKAYSFCKHTVEAKNIFVVEDARKDERFKDNPFVTGYPNIAFYVGMPLINEQGYALGSLCVIDQEKKTLTEQQRKSLQTLARQIMDKLELRRKVAELQAANLQIKDLQQETLSQKTEASEVIKHTPMAMALHVGENMTIRFANDLMLKAWDKSEAVFGQTFAEALPELAALDFPLTMRQVYRTGVPYKQEESHMKYEHQGEIKEFYYTYEFTPLKLADGKVWGILNTALDLTQTVKNRLKAERAEEQLRLAVESAELGTWFIDAYTREFIASPRLKELFGYQPDEPMSFEEAIAQITDDYRDGVLQAVEAALTNGEAYDLEYKVVGYHDKKLRWVRATGKLYPAAEGNAPFFSGTVFDVTERKQDEQRKNDFIGMVSHELRSPLTSISGYTQVLGLKAKKLEDVSIQDIAQKTKRQVDRMSGLISGFLDVARLGEGKIRLNRQCFDMATLVKEAEEESLATITTHKVIFKPVEFTPVEADREKIMQVLINFINNAVKYSPPGSNIQVACVTHNRMARVSVTDEGIGISACEQQHVFDRFYRVESEQMKTVKGFGIGLYICKEIVERHNGVIGVSSEPGKGSTFWFELPVT
jgi:two-component system, OmpR family, sensor histidine kinase VicK